MLDRIVRQHRRRQQSGEPVRLRLGLVALLQVLIREESQGTADENERVDAEAEAGGVAGGFGRGRGGGGGRGGFRGGVAGLARYGQWGWVDGGGGWVKGKVR